MAGVSVVGCENSTPLTRRLLRNSCRFNAYQVLAQTMLSANWRNGRHIDGPVGALNFFEQLLRRELSMRSAHLRIRG